MLKLMQHNCNPCWTWLEQHPSLSLLAKRKIISEIITQILLNTKFLSYGSYWMENPQLSSSNPPQRHQLILISINLLGTPTHLVAVEKVPVVLHKGWGPCQSPDRAFSPACLDCNWFYWCVLGCTLSLPNCQRLPFRSEWRHICVS